MNKKQGGAKMTINQFKKWKNKKKEEINLKAENHFSNWFSFIQKSGNQFKSDKNTKKWNLFKKWKIAFQSDFHLPIQKRGNHFKKWKTLKKRKSV